MLSSFTQTYARQANTFINTALTPKSLKAKSPQNLKFTEPSTASSDFNLQLQFKRCFEGWNVYMIDKFSLMLVMLLITAVL